jgi:F-type H+-transporting ATPase subunit b
MPLAVGQAAAAAEQGSGGLPQFDSSQWAGQIVWMLFTFGVLLLLFHLLITPRLGGTIAKREDKISGDIGQARRLRDEAEAQSRAAAAELADARKRAHALAAEARAAANAEAGHRQADEEARLSRRLSEAEAGIAVARAEAMGHVRGIASEAVAAIVEKLTGRTASEDEVERALDRVG